MKNDNLKKGQCEHNNNDGEKKTITHKKNWHIIPLTKISNLLTIQ